MFAPLEFVIVCIIAYEMVHAFRTYSVPYDRDTLYMHRIVYGLIIHCGFVQEAN
jgi:hypothetical protein